MSNPNPNPHPDPNPDPDPDPNTTPAPDPLPAVLISAQVRLGRAGDHTACPSGELTPGTLAYDTAVKRVGVVMDECGTHIWLRPVHGGCEWEVLRGDVRAATVADQLSAALAEANANSRQRVRSAGTPWG
ncbi:hypothetical protein [Streptomyces sp. CAU 1734]|uniref:hypothetical protein n=1 Tax=Streptomyces sp. CAU 1734 TaxID=3140360 RepID=UPI0032604A1A